MVSYPVRFSVYNHNLIVKDNQLITRKFICLKMSDGTQKFTIFQKYAKNPNYRIRRMNDGDDPRCTYITQLLNYAFFFKGIKSLNEITVDIIKEFLNDYGKCELPYDDDNTHRNKETVERCVNIILGFMELYICDNKKCCKMKTDDLYKWVDYRDHNGKIRHKKVPVFDVVYTGVTTREIFRDMPNKVFEIIFNHIAIHHTQILGLVFLSSFAGLRPAESCNVRRPGSIFGHGIIFTTIDNEVTKIQIDLRKEYVLRSDRLPTGKIKKERMQTVPDIFLKAFVNSYNIYMEYLEGKPYETDYAPFTINKQGKAYTYDSFYGKFQEIIKDEIIPILLADEDAEVVLYGRMLLEHKLSPHIFRHWYTVQLVLSGISEPGVLMSHRGDSSPDSALTYIKNKSELQKQFNRVNNENFDYLSWLAKKRHEK